MLMIGLTGPTGAGKGAFSRYLAEKHGIPSIDADAVYHSLLVPPSPCLDALTEAFGTDILNPDGTLDRKKLASIVFSSENPEHRKMQKNRLNEITHGFIMRRVSEIASEWAQNGVSAIIFDAPALYEANGDRICTKTVAVLASKEIRKARIIARDGLTEAQAEMRIRAQHSDAFYTSRADAVLYNDGTTEELGEAAEAFYETHLKPLLPST